MIIAAKSAAPIHLAMEPIRDMRDETTTFRGRRG
jgi:hypothetical protein